MCQGRPLAVVSGPTLTAAAVATFRAGAVTVGSGEKRLVGAITHEPSTHAAMKLNTMPLNEPFEVHVENRLRSNVWLPWHHASAT